MKKFLILLLISLNSFAMPDSNCADLANDCEYYSCISAEKHCDNRSYPTQYGRRFCMRYGDQISKFSAQGRLWVANVRKCLINEMENFEDGLTCGELKVKAFESHVGCYIDQGFCELSLIDKQKIMTTIWPGLLSVLAFQNGMGVLSACYTSKI